MKRGEQEVMAEPHPLIREGAAPDTPMPKQTRVCLSADEATAVVSAAFGEDHDAPTFDRAIKRLGDFVDHSLGLSPPSPSPKGGADG